VIQISFTSANGGRTITVEAPDGARLLDVAQACDQPLEGTCEGQMACSTCHVIIDAADFAKLPRASEEEEDMLDLAGGVTRYSRLACQIRLSDEMQSLSVRMPGFVHNMQGR
jgi:ferredoxin